jgi:negative regulator of sigma E activity
LTISDELLSAYLDGELSGDDLKRVEQALTTDTAAKKRFAQLRRSDEMVNTVAASIDDEPLPDAIAQLLGPSKEAGDDKNVVAFTPKERRPSVNRWALPLAASIALAIGFGGGAALGPFSNGANAPLEMAMITPGNPLFAVLEKNASGKAIALDEKQKAEVRLTFQDADSKFCREFLVGNQLNATSAVACREGQNQWQVRIAAESQPFSNDDGGYSTASSEGEIFGAAVDQMMASEPLDGDSEQKLIASRWQRAREGK